METRKMQKVGGGTFTVSIPKDWADEQGLEAGTTVHLYTHADGSILVRSSPRDGDELETAVIDLDGDAPERVVRTLRAAHAVGFETVTLLPETAFTDDQRAAVPAVARDLIGAEVRTGTDDELVVQNLLDPSDVSVRQSVVQLSFSALSIHRRATRAFVEADGDVHEELRERHDEVGRLFAMISRHFNRSLVSLEELDRLGTSRAELFDYYVTARRLERIAAISMESARLADTLDEPLPPAPTDEVEGVADATRELVDDAVTAVLDGRSVERVHDLLDRRDALGERLAEVERGSVDVSPPHATPLALTVDALRRITDRGGAVADVALRAAIRSGRL